MEENKKTFKSLPPVGSSHVYMIHYLCTATDALEGAASPFSGKDPGQASPMSDRKKNRRKKSMNQKGDAAVGQAEGELTTESRVFTRKCW